MKILALETATEFAGIGISGDGLFNEFIIKTAVARGNSIMGFIDRLLKNNNLDPGEIDLFAAGIGPGLYTGLRCGISIMKGFTICTGKPLIGIPTLDTIANNFAGYRDKIAVILNAYGGEIYGGIYDGLRHTGQKNAYFVGRIEDFLKRLNPVRDRTIFAGTGLRIYQKHIEGMLGHAAIFAPAENWIPRPASLAKLALERFRKGRLPHPDRILPLYLKESEAERKWKGSHSRP